MNNIVKLLIIVSAVVLLLFLKIALDTREEVAPSASIAPQTVIDEEETEIEGAKVGESMPSFTLTTEEGELKSDDIKGAYVIEFIATTCPYCKASAPSFQAVFRDSSTPYIVVSAIGESMGAMKAWKRDYLQGTDAVVATGPGNLIQDLALRGTPTTVFVDGDGKISSLYPGEISESDIRSLLSAIE